MSSVLSTLKNYWAANSVLQSALPVSSVYLVLVPQSFQFNFPYCVLTVISEIPEYMTGGAIINTVRFQLSLFHTDADTLETLADRIATQFDQAYITSTSLICTRQNRIPQVDISTGNYVYSVILEYLWSFNA